MPMARKFREPSTVLAGALALLALCPNGAWPQSYGVVAPAASESACDNPEGNLLDLSVEEILDCLTVAQKARGAKGAGHSRVATPIRFGNGSAAVNEADAARLWKLAEAMKRGHLHEERLSIEGHANATGTADANVRLTRRRADNVIAILRQYGIAERRMVGVGYGFSEPLPQFDVTDPRQRRVELRILERSRSD